MILNMKHVKTVYFLLFVVLHNVHANIYSNKSAITLRHGMDNYFGYSVLLQHGSSKPPRVVIGAPKDGPNKVGAVFDCFVNTVQQPSWFNCVNYSIDHKRLGNTNDIVFESNMFGAALAGGTNQNDDVMITSPKLTENTQQSRFTIGGVFKLDDLRKSTFEKYPKETEDFIFDGEYRYGYAEYGFSAHAINSSEFLYGAPGYKHWQGNAYHAFQTDSSDVPAARRHSYQRNRRGTGEKVEHVINRNVDLNALAGYAVTSGNFFNYISYVIGMPNARNMFGNVVLYKQADGYIAEHLRIDEVGQKIGEHFGSALASADVNGDGYDDLLIGAPNYAESNSFDNGKVYVFLSNTRNQFKLHQELKGDIQCRFGTSITNLGKITLDSHDAIAIGSPYQDGMGAVHVYIWMRAQLVLDSKIQFSDFKSFGYSLSRAIDIDNNKIADFVVGDYKSNSVALLTAKHVFYYDVIVQHPTLHADKENEIFDLNICIHVKRIQIEVNTEITIDFDIRFKQLQTYSKKLNFNYHCIHLEKLELNPKAHRLEPLNLYIKLQEDVCDTCPVASPTYEKNFNKKIPFNRNCKGEICHPKIQTSLEFTSNSIVVGAMNQHELSVDIENTGDPAFICTVDVRTTPVAPISVVKSSKCVVMPCEYNFIINNMQEKYLLDFSDWTLFNQNLDVAVQTDCINVTVTTHKTLKLNYEQTLDIKGVTVTAQYDSSNTSSFDVTGTIAFIIKNEGPSGLEKQDFEIKVPRISQDVHIIDIYQPVSQLGYKLEIDEMFDTPVEFNPPNPDDEVAAASFGKSANALNTISCQNPNIECMTIRGHILALFKGGHVTISIPIRPNINEILKKFRTTFSIASTIQMNKQDNLFIASLDVVDQQTLLEPVDIWIIVIAVIVSLLLLALVIFFLYKCKFFTRATHEKLMEMQDQEEMLEEVELRHPEVDQARIDNISAEVYINKVEEVSSNVSNDKQEKVLIE